MPGVQKSVGTFDPFDKNPATAGFFMLHKSY
jgi:hypothetical protein